ncbi:hypothetical protein F7725_009686 [Dissostichus mawsoni]|uniref:Uncharacterized protein n=1 Tax=Dissostichus mawsoni TaxID=36200 RepID=A0A7J5XPC2_DISMA|nr:hypothetical protein F7725_009686 [Dissostichus mawsoni]
MQARHYKTLQELWKKTTPNQQDVGHLLDLEFESRRAFIDSCSLKEEDRTEKVIEAYPCFREHKHVTGQAIALMKALPSMFPSPTAPPKKLGSASEALIHVLEPSEDPNTFLQKRPITSPVILVDSTNLLLAVGKISLMTLPKEMIHEAPLILMGCFYTFHLTYPKCVTTLLSVIQTEVLKDSIHERDLTHSYKKAIAEWGEFTKK